MKKVKYLLLLLVFLLGIGISFANQNYFYGVEYFDDNNRFSNFIFNAGGYGTITFDSANVGDFTGLDSVWYYGTGKKSLDLSKYSLTSSFDLGSNNNTNLYVSGNDISFLINSNDSYYSIYFNYLFNISNSVTDINKLLLQNTGFFIRTETHQGDGIFISNPFKQSISPVGIRSWIFQDYRVYDTYFNSYFNDTEFSGSIYRRGNIVPGVGNTYSFSIVPNMSLNTGNQQLTIDFESVPYYFRTVIPSLSSTGWTSYRGLYILKLDSFYGKTDTGDFRILSLGLSGDNFIYSRYSCPSNVLRFFDCSFIDGGYIGQSNLDTSFTSFKSSIIYNIQEYNPNNAFKNLFFYLSVPSSYSNTFFFYSSPSIYSIESSNIIHLYRPYVYKSSKYGAMSSVLNHKTFGLIPIDGINIFDSLQSGQQVFYNLTGVVNVSGCINTEICTNTTGIDGNIHTSCITTCVAESVVFSGGYISSDGTYYFVNAPLSLNNLKNSDLSFSTGYLDSGGILDPVFFEDLFDPGKKAVGVCPFPYYSGPLDFMSDISFEGVYLFMPLICFYSAFQHGSHLTYFDNPNIISGGVISTPLLNGNSENHRILFIFFDILLSIGLLGLFHHLSSLL